jgi:hypothetical protein
VAAVCSVAPTVVALAGTTGVSFTAVMLVVRSTLTSLNRVWPPLTLTSRVAPVVTAPPELSIR